MNTIWEQPKTQQKKKKINKANKEEKASLSSVLLLLQMLLLEDFDKNVYVSVASIVWELYFRLDSVNGGLFKQCWGNIKGHVSKKLNSAYEKCVSEVKKAYFV